MAFTWDPSIKQKSKQTPLMVKCLYKIIDHTFSYEVQIHRNEIGRLQRKESYICAFAPTHVTRSLKSLHCNGALLQVNWKPLNLLAYQCFDWINMFYVVTILSPVNVIEYATIWRTISGECVYNAARVLYVLLTLDQFEGAGLIIALRIIVISSLTRVIHLW